MKKIFKNWSKFEVILLITSIVIIIFSGIISKSEILTVFTSISGVLCALLMAKGKVISQVVGLVEIVLYTILSYKNEYYGEVIIYITVQLPLYIVGIVSWIKNKNEETETVNKNKINKIEWILLLFVNMFAFIALYKILQYFNTKQLIVSTISMITSLSATYLLARRSKYGFIFYILNDVILILLWGVPILQGDLTLIPILIEPVILFINDSYGWKNWNK